MVVDGGKLLRPGETRGDRRRGAAMTGRRSRWAVVTALTILPAACEQKSEQAAEPIRPVLSVIAEPESGRTLGFAGVVEPRYEAELGFQLLGRMISRDVNVGDLVTEGQRLAALDPISTELAVRIAESDLTSTDAQLANALATEDGCGRCFRTRLQRKRISRPRSRRASPRSRPGKVPRQTSPRRASN